MRGSLLKRFPIATVTILVITCTLFVRSLYAPNSDVSRVIIVSYQRSGSSFLGEIFNQNPKAMQWFEPLDGVYSALYGTRYGFNVPADLWNMPNGSERAIPMSELTALANVTSSILNCQFDQLPTEVLLHSFVPMFLKQHKRLTPYAKCIQDGKPALGVCNKCNLELSSVCSKRFDVSQSNLQMCANELALRHDPSATPPFPFVTSSKSVRKAVEKYRDCMKPCRSKALKCSSYLANSCHHARVRNIKPVRLPMSAARLVHQSLPDVKIIHNIRDPRGVVHSRKYVSESFHSAFAMYRTPVVSKRKRDTKKSPAYFTTVDVAKEAMLLCRNVAEDVIVRREMLKDDPGCAKEILYENYATQPLAVTQDIYDFIGQPLPHQVLQWLAENTTGEKVNSQKQTSRQANVTMLKWQDELSVRDMAAVNGHCKYLFEIMHHVPWQFT
ncbi:hypothetical protein CAPTEDRAFT_193000 [Capitella teleta]|uniref:Uncharacterized protein n=1 Tax=Capitella teleta TaxID=283909 RepID=R7TKQ0_CAPTE|nr:hypothetical protein CAPTEDRAFT_193000 [Capitella teleta]|eukprot:ELT94373.1 hypothetical protein CAPTEDRAFT_193000 [Capitella teleta]